MWAASLSQLGFLKWFESDAVDAQNLGGKDWLVVGVVVVVGLLMATLLMGRLSGVYNKLGARFESKRRWLPLVIRLTSGGALLFAAWKHYVVLPGVSPADSWMFGFEFFVGLCWALGIFEKLALLVVVALLGWIGIRTGVSNVVDCLLLLGAGGYLALKGNGPLSLGAVFDKPQKIEGNRNYLAYRFYELVFGVSLVVGAFIDDLSHPRLLSDLVERHSWNFLSSLGVSDWLFAIVLASIGLLLGLLLILNRIPRIVAIVAFMVPLVLSLLLHASNLYGHLYVVGIFAVLLLGELKATVHLPKGRVRSTASL